MGQMRRVRGVNERESVLPVTVMLADAEDGLLLDTVHV